MPSPGTRSASQPHYVDCASFEGVQRLEVLYMLSFKPMRMYSTDLGYLENWSCKMIRRPR